MAYVPETRPTTRALPPAARLNGGRPVLGVDMQAFASALNHLAGTTYRGHWGPIVEVDASAVESGIYDARYLPPPPQVSSVTHAFAVYLSPHARHLFVDLVVTADDEGTTSARVDVSLKSLSGATTYDIGIRFDGQEGTLDSGKTVRATAAGPMTLYLPTQANSGSRIDDGAASGGSVTPPRLLYVPSGARGARVQVEAVTTRCRLLGMTVMEWQEAEV